MPLRILSLYDVKEVFQVHFGDGGTFHAFGQMLFGETAASNVATATVAAATPIITLVCRRRRCGCDSELYGIAVAFWSKGHHLREMGFYCA